MKHKKIIIGSIIAVILIVIGFFVYSYFTKQDKNTTLTILEKQWIESNKNKVIDLSITNDIPVFNYNGNGVFFDFLNDLVKDTKLEFNKLSYEASEQPKSDYAFAIVDTAGDKDILVYEDNYALLTKKKETYHQMNEIKNLKIGVLKSDLEKVNKYLKDASNVSYQSFDDVATLLDAINPVKKEGETEQPVAKIDAMVLPKTMYLDKIVPNEAYTIAYTLSDLSKKYVLRLGNTDKLNVILKKYYQKWQKESYATSYDQHLSSNYFEFALVDEKQKAKFKSKRYAYGFVTNVPYDSVSKGKLVGFNNTIMRNFKTISDTEISFKEYPSMEELVKDFNENKLDFFLNTNETTKYSMDVFETVSLYHDPIVVLSNLNSSYSIQSIYSLEGKSVKAVKGTKIAEYLTNQHINAKLYHTMNELLDNFEKEDILLIDHSSYDYYSRNQLSNTKIDYQFYLDSPYSFVVRDIKDNQVFAHFLSFYASYIDPLQVKNKTYQQLFLEPNTSKLWSNVLLGLSAIIVGGFAIFGAYKLINVKTKKKKKILSKEEKLKYIDMLTSLKNRNYLNDNIEKWDDSEVYPQTILIIDLNNVAYINDNYGHQEGDNVIKEAANILIKNQYPNSDIIRTNGNEFLIYLVGYDEKQMVTYMRKLSKELKELAHGFGAAIGYSMINDAIKTIDDAVNEATLDMKNNKEEQSN